MTMKCVLNNIELPHSYKMSLKQENKNIAARFSFFIKKKLPG